MCLDADKLQAGQELRHPAGKGSWDDFIREFDSIKLHDKNGRTYSPKTNLRGSKGTVWLYLESRS